METTSVVNSKTVRQKLGSIILDLKYVDGKIFLVEKVGEEDYCAVILSARFCRENGIDIPEKGKDPKPDPKKKK